MNKHLVAVLITFTSILFFPTMGHARQKFFERFFFFPSKWNDSTPTPSQRGLSYRDFFIPTHDGETLHGWEIFPTQHIYSNPRYVIQFHGNGGNISNHIGYIAWLASRGYHLIQFDYRGYGKSSGTPSLRGLYVDGVQFLAAIRDQIPANAEIILLGQSLGGITMYRAALDCDWCNSSHAIILDSTFDSYRKIIQKKAGILSRFVGSYYDQFSIDTRLEGSPLTEAPLLVVHANQDPVVPFEFSSMIADKASHHHLEQWTIPGRYHADYWYKNDSASHKFREKITDYFDALE